MSNLKQQLEELRTGDVLKQIEKAKEKFANSPIALRMLELAEAKAKAQMDNEE